MHSKKKNKAHYREVSFKSLTKMYLFLPLFLSPFLFVKHIGNLARSFRKLLAPIPKVLIYLKHSATLTRLPISEEIPIKRVHFNEDASVYIYSVCPPVRFAKNRRRKARDKRERNRIRSRPSLQETNLD